MNEFHFFKTRRRQGLLALALSASGHTAHAWLEKDCKEPEPYGKLPFSCAESPKISRQMFRCTGWMHSSECIGAARLVAQQRQPDGKPITEVKRLARVRSILSRQKTIRFYSAIVDKKSYEAKTDTAPPLCQQRLQDLREGRGYEPIEPVYVLNDEWEAADPAVASQDKDAPRLPAVWNRCAYAKEKFDSTKFLSLAESAYSRQHLLPPFRLYELSEAQRPSPEWRYTVDMTLNHSQSFIAYSLEGDCQPKNSISSTAFTGHEDSWRTQSWALTRYRGQLVVPSIIDGQSLWLDDQKGNTCSWVFYPDTASIEK